MVNKNKIKSMKDNFKIVREFLKKFADTPVEGKEAVAASEAEVAEEQAEEVVAASEPIQVPLADGTALTCDKVEVGGVAMVGTDLANAGDYITKDGDTITVGDNGVIGAIAKASPEAQVAEEPVAAAEEAKPVEDKEKAMAAFNDEMAERLEVLERAFFNFNEANNKKLDEISNNIKAFGEKPANTPVVQEVVKPVRATQRSIGLNLDALKRK